MMVCCQSACVKREVDFIKYSVGAVLQLRRNLSADFGITDEPELGNELGHLLYTHHLEKAFM